MNSSKFLDFILQHKVAAFHETPITLASGRTSHFYVNWRSISEDCMLFSELTQHVLRYMDEQHLSPDLVYGVPEGGTKLGLIIQFLRSQKTPGRLLSMGRGKPKERGPAKDRLFLGVPQGKILIIEDVTTTGDSLIQCIEQLRTIEGAHVSDALILTDRNENRDDGRTVKEAIESLGVRFHALSNARDILPRLQGKQS